MRQDWHDKHYAFFQNRECEYFPCHNGVEESDFNCLFCYCPLYLTGKKCGGNFGVSKSGIKDCTGCNIPHRRENYEYIVEKFKKLRKEISNES
jgi:Zn-finger protein